MRVGTTLWRLNLAGLRGARVVVLAGKAHRCDDESERDHLTTRRSSLFGLFFI
jgi:hypothetical protein